MSKPPKKPPRPPRMVASRLRRSQGHQAMTDRINGIIDIWSMRPPPLSPEGRAWEDGARQGWEWAQAENEQLRALKTPASSQLLNITKALLDDANAEIERLRADIKVERRRCIKIVRERLNTGEYERSLGQSIAAALAGKP